MIVVALKVIKVSAYDAQATQWTDWFVAAEVLHKDL